MGMPEAGDVHVSVALVMGTLLAAIVVSVALAGGWGLPAGMMAVLVFVTGPPPMALRAEACSQ
jgi:hypothetical protein